MPIKKDALERILKRDARYELFIIDEIGYLSIKDNDASLLLQLFNRPVSILFSHCHGQSSLTVWGVLIKIQERLRLF